MSSGQNVGKYVIQRKLGQGAFGAVYLVQDSETGIEYALKIFRGPRGERDYRNEVVAYQNLSAIPNCDKYITCAFDKGRSETIEGETFYYIVTELMSGDLTKFIFGPDRPSSIRIYNPLSILLIMLQTLKSLRDIHNKDLSHSDVKPANILYKVPPFTVQNEEYFNEPQNIIDEVKIKFGDPGLACTEPERKLLSPEKSPLRKSRSCLPGGTMFYMGPQFYQHFIERIHVDNLEFFQKNDIWGTGKVFREIVFGSSDPLPSPDKIFSQADIPPSNFTSGNPMMDTAINTVINNMVVYDWKERLNASYLARELEMFILNIIEEGEEIMEEVIEISPSRVVTREIVEIPVEEEVIEIPPSEILIEDPPLIGDSIVVSDVETGDKLFVRFSFYETGYEFLERVFPDRDVRFHALYFCPEGSTICDILPSRSRKMIENGVQPSGQLVLGYLPVTGFEKTIDIRPKPLPRRTRPTKFKTPKSPARVFPRQSRRDKFFPSPTRSKAFLPRESTRYSSGLAPPGRTPEPKTPRGRIRGFERPSRLSSREI